MSADPVAPAGVRIRHADGTRTPCELVRDEESDHDGIAAWLAVLPEGATFDPPAGDSVEADFLPGRTSLVIAMPELTEPDNACEGSP